MNDAPSSPSLVATFAAEIEAEGILFDMDGVLVCSTGGDDRCWMQWAEHHKTPLDIRRTHGRRAADTLREHLPGAGDDVIRDHLAQLDTFAAEEQTGVIAYPGVKELLQSLPPYRWTVVTSASESMMRDRLRVAGITAPAHVVAGDHVAKGEPDPEGYRRGAMLLSRSPGDCVVIEDAPAGVRAGEAGRVPGDRHPLVAPGRRAPRSRLACTVSRPNHHLCRRFRNTQTQLSSSHSEPSDVEDPDEARASEL